MFMDKSRIDVITMGCSKNLVDSERLLKRLEAKGYKAHHNSHDVKGSIVIVNTCGFIGDAKEESIDMILQLIEAKKRKRIGSIIVMGCLSERYRKELQAEMPEVDKWYGKFDWNEIIDGLPSCNPKANDTCKSWERKLTTPPYSAYLKISEGCNRFCAYCAIPLITGRHKSRPIEELLAEAEELAKKGVKELNVIAQDLSSYGMDLYRQSKLAELVHRLTEIEGIEWIRLHYAYPVDFPWDVLDVMRNNEKVCNYIDIALQHISTKVLDNMRRHINKEQTLELIAKIREKVPGIKIRTTLMTGFPGEGEKEFEELLEFVENKRFDRMGAFAYSEEEDTWGAQNFPDDIPQETKEERLDRLMSLQEKVSEDLNRQMIGTTVKVLVEGIEDNILVGRTQWDSPEVDPSIYVTVPEQLIASYKPGDFVEATVTDADTFDLFAELKHK